MIRGALIQESFFIDESTLDWTVPKDLFYFQGHFPNNPVLPAVAILDLSYEFINSKKDNRLNLSKIKNAKFTQPIVPNQRVRLRYSYEQNNIYKILWVDPNETKIFAQITLELIELH